MNRMVRERESHVDRLFIEVTPGIRRALELLAEASITLLDEIDAPVDEIEEDPDFEYLAEDDEAGGDHEPNVGWSTEGCIFGGDDEREPNLGWTNDGDTTGEDADDDLASAESSAGLPRVTIGRGEARAEMMAAFDPRLSRRPLAEVREWTETQPGVRFAPGAWHSPSIPPFPHDRPDRAAFHIEAEIRRLNRALLPITAKRRRRSGVK